MKTDKTDNEIIAEFMDEVVFQKRPRHYIGVTENMKPYKLADKLKYNSSWDWLMPVVEKIHSMGIQVEISIKRCMIHGLYDGKIIDQNWSKATPLIEIVYKACVEFIKGYNNQQSK